MKQFQKIFTVMLLIFMITGCKLEKEEASSAPAIVPVGNLILSNLVVSFSCSTSTDCADNSADSSGASNGASVVFSQGATIVAWAIGVPVSCSGGVCTGATNSSTTWINLSFATVTELQAGTYMLTVAMDSNGDNTYGGSGEPQFYNPAQSVNSSVTAISINSGFGNASFVQAQQNENRTLMLRDSYLID